MPNPLVPPGEIHLHWLRHDATRGRAPLRALLADYLAVTADDVCIVQSEPHLKPRLAPPHAGLHFNWSHSGALAVVALAVDIDPGVDVEQIERRNDIMAIARRFYADDEVAALTALEPGQRRDGFTRAWTLKEAVVKAEGGGLAQALSHVAVAFEGNSTLLQRVPTGDPAEWQCAMLQPPLPGYRAALAWRGGPRRIVVHGGETLSSIVTPESTP